MIVPPDGSMMAIPEISDYAMVGDRQTAALINRQGRVDWLCWPDFSSPACCAALVGSPANGYWSLSPANTRVEFSRRYVPHTLLLETTMKTHGGTVVMTDFMPVDGRHSSLVRHVACTEGSVELRTELKLRFDYGSTVPWIHELQEESGQGWILSAGPSVVSLRTAVAMSCAEQGLLAATFVLKAGEVRTFILSHGVTCDDMPPRLDPVAEMEHTAQFWSGWAEKSTYNGDHRELVERSLLTLKALTYRFSGGIVAAPTTSLPERSGGSLNWDYRYCWIRDASLTVLALVDAGYCQEILDWKAWLLRAVGQDASEVQIMYGICGERHISHWTVAWLQGYRRSVPVRIGNIAEQQTQQDIYGEIALALYHASEAGLTATQDELTLQKRLTEQLVRVWRQPGSGMWEERGKQRKFVYSQVMAWAALDLAVKRAENGEIEGPIAKWVRLRDHIHREVCRKGFSRRLNSFVQHYGSYRLDASVLLLPIIGFLPAHDPRIVGTVAAIEKRLMRGALLLRNVPKKAKAEQGAFLACSFWLVEVYAMMGRLNDAKALFERAAGVANDIGLLSEEYDWKHRQLAGNYPQAFSHIALVRAAFRIAKHSPQPARV